MKATTYRAGLALVGLIFVLLMSFDSVHLWLVGANDFAPLYVGTKLVGTEDLYASEPYYAFLRQHFGGMNESLRFTRLPHHAVMFWPLGLLSYDTAHVVWTLLRLAAIGGFLYFWKSAWRSDAIHLTALCLPLSISLFNGQDTPFLLLWIALSLHWHGKGRPFLAGLALALCAAKFHLFVLLPILFFGQRRWSMTAGFASGGAVLAAVSFAVAGISWPAEYFATLTDGRVHPGAEIMPNLHGVFASLPQGTLLEMLAGVMVAVAAWQVVRRSSFELGLAAVLAGGMLLSYHAYVADCTILLPAALLVSSANPPRAMRFFAAMLLTPVLYLTMSMSFPVSFLLPATIGLFLGTLAIGAGREVVAAAPIVAQREVAQPARSLSATA